MAWAIAAWEEDTGRGTVTSDMGELPFDDTTVKRQPFFDGFRPGDSVSVTLAKSGTSYVVTSVKLALDIGREIKRILAGGAIDLVVLPQSGQTLPLKASGANGTLWLLFFDPLHFDLPSTMKAVTRFEWRGWEEIADEEPDLAKRWGIDPDEVGGEIASFYDAAGAPVGHVLFANSFTLWRRAEPPPGIAAEAAS